MKRVVINAVCAMLLMIIQSNVDSAFGIDYVCQFVVIAAVLTGAGAMPMISSCVSMLILACVVDFFVSGPIGLYAFICMVVFGISRALLTRFRSERLIAVMFWGCLLCVLFESLLAVVYSLYYWNGQFWHIFARSVWVDAILTALFTPVLMWIEHLVERILSRRHASGLN